MAKPKCVKVKNKIFTKNRAMALLAAVVCVCGLMAWMLWERSTPSGENSTIYLKRGISIETATSYTGPFWEDGTDRAVEDVWQLTLYNSSEDDIQYMKIVAKDREGSILGQFELTMLTAGSTICVLESSAAQMPQDWHACTYTIENLAFLKEERSLHSDMFTLSAAQQWIRLENHSQQDVNQDIYVYYKRVEDGILMGGITYRVKFAGGLDAGDTQEEQAVHYDPDTCEIMYLTYQ